jgi:hypothetical protein
VQDFIRKVRAGHNPFRREPEPHIKDAAYNLYLDELSVSAGVLPEQTFRQRIKSSRVLLGLCKLDALKLRKLVLPALGGAAMGGFVGERAIPAVKAAWAILTYLHAADMAVVKQLGDLAAAMPHFPSLHPLFQAPVYDESTLAALGALAVFGGFSGALNKMRVASHWHFTKQDLHDAYDDLCERMGLPTGRELFGPMPANIALDPGVDPLDVLELDEGLRSTRQDARRAFVRLVESRQSLEARSQLRSAFTEVLPQLKDG